jgi:hypothetical protein
MARLQDANYDRGVYLVSEIKDLYNKDLNTDCILSVGKAKFRCHSVLLAMVSEVCRNILPHQPGEDKEDTVVILPDWGEGVLELVVTLFYCGEVRYEAVTNQRANIAALLDSLGVPALELQDIHCERIKEQVASLCEESPPSDEDFSRKVNEAHSVSDEMFPPEHIISPSYEDQEEDDKIDMVVDEGFSKNVNEEHSVIDEIVPPEHIISPCYEEEDCVSTFQGGNVNQVFESLSPRVTFQVSHNTKTKCGKSCQDKCLAVFETWSSIQKLLLKTLFQGEKCSDVRKNLLAHLKSQANVGLNTDGYHINNHTF